MNVAIVNDSKTAAEVLRRILAELPGFSLLWIAYSGEEALERVAVAQPDIILMDLIMPGIDGAETTRRIMRSNPCVILVVTATTVGNRSQVFEAMGHGALDAVNTPTLGPNGDMAGAEPLLQKLRTVARLVSPPRPLPPVEADLSHSVIRKAVDKSTLPIVAIGASTGGPQALAQVLSAFPANFPAAVLIAQHVDEHFAKGLADWLQHHTPLNVRIAQHGDPLAAGHILVAGSKDHLIYNDGGFVTYTPHPLETPYRPSVDALFTSLAQPHRATCVGVLLTGMGRDGAAGMKELHDLGACTLAQDAESSVVFGMARKAVELDAVDSVVPLDNMAAAILKALEHHHNHLHHHPRTPSTTYAKSAA
jgi:two-component system, chemotaxis family, response regulator WspF